MEVSSLTGMALAMKSAQTQQGMAVSLLKMAAVQQDQLAAMVAQNAQTAPQNTQTGDYAFSTYA